MGCCFSSEQTPATQSKPKNREKDLQNEMNGNQAPSINVTPPQSDRQPGPTFVPTDKDNQDQNPIDQNRPLLFAESVETDFDPNAVKKYHKPSVESSKKDTEEVKYNPQYTEPDDQASSRHQSNFTKPVDTPV